MLQFSWSIVNALRALHITGGIQRLLEFKYFTIVWDLSTKEFYFLGFKGVLSLLLYVFCIKKSFSSDHFFWDREILGIRIFEGFQAEQCNVVIVLSLCYVIHLVINKLSLHWVVWKSSSKTNVYIVFIWRMRKFLACIDPK